MDDEQIVALYWDRNESAIRETADKYGTYCYSIAYGILYSEEDARESVNDTYLSAWNSIPPHRPHILRTFLGKLTRRLSIDRWRKGHADKRGGGEMPAVVEELSACVAVEGDPVTEAERKLLDEVVSTFIKELGDREQRVFLCRYWYAEPVKGIAGRFGFSEGKVKMMLLRTRRRLHDRLKKEGLL